MKSVYILNVQNTGINGGVIHYVEAAYVDVSKAIERELELNVFYKDDSNYMSYITGPVPLI